MGPPGQNANGGKIVGLNQHIGHFRQIPDDTHLAVAHHQGQGRINNLLARAL